MKKISSQTTLLYQIVFPIFFGFFLLVVIKLMFTIPFMIVIGFIYIIVYIWIVPIFVKLKDVWLDNDCLLITDVSGKKATINKKDIIQISQNASMITPRLVIITLKSENTEQVFRFIPTGGSWIFWQHEIVEELNTWRSKD